MKQTLEIHGRQVDRPGEGDGRPSTAVDMTLEASCSPRPRDWKESWKAACAGDGPQEGERTRAYGKAAVLTGRGAAPVPPTRPRDHLAQTYRRRRRRQRRQRQERRGPTSATHLVVDRPMNELSATAPGRRGRVADCAVVAGASVFSALRAGGSDVSSKSASRLEHPLRRRHASTVNVL